MHACFACMGICVKVYDPLGTGVTCGYELPCEMTQQLRACTVLPDDQFGSQYLCLVAHTHLHTQC